MFTICVQPWQRALVRKVGEPTRVLGPGRHRRRRRATYLWLDDRQRMDHVAPQEVLTADGVTVKVTAVVRWRIGDPVRFTEVVAHPFASVYLAVQLALRDAVTALEADAVARSARTDVGAVALQAAVAAGDAAGVEVLKVLVKDVILPGDLRAAYAEVVTGRQRALAQLEAARAETAAPRSLASGVKLLDDRPALAQLRLVQALPIGSTVELRTGPGESRLIRRPTDRGPAGTSGPSGWAKLRNGWRSGPVRGCRGVGTTPSAPTWPRSRNSRYARSPGRGTCGGEWCR